MEVYGQEISLPPAVLSKAQEKDVLAAAKDYAAQQIADYITDKIISENNLEKFYPQIEEIIEKAKHQIEEGLHRMVKRAMASFEREEW